MTKYIEREALQRCRFIQDEWGEWILKEDIINLPAADVRPVVRGKWEQVDDYRYPWGCTNCRKTFSGRYSFCPNCGADMKEEQDGR